jgi:hypothetical protein
MRAWIAQAAPGALLALAAIAILNALFLAASVGAASAARMTRAEAVQQAFATGELVDRDYLKSDWRRGKDQYNDCVVLQLVINPRSSVAQKALAPVLYGSSGSSPDVCRSLRHLAFGADAASIPGDSYSRYWRGYVPLTSALLGFIDVGTARQGLRLAVIAALLALVAVAARAGEATRVAGISVAVTGLLFWGLPYYGQGLSFAPGDAVVMSGIAALIALRRPLQVGPRLTVFSAAYGSFVAFFDFLTGPLPTGACLIFLFAYLVRFDSSRGARRQHAWRDAFVALTAYAVGAVTTLVIKQLIVLVLFGPGELQSLLANARLYTGLADGGMPASYFAAFWTLFKYTPLLTYYSIAGGAALLLCFALSWLAAVYFVLRSGAPARKSLLLAHAVGASGIALWVLLLPGHTALHGFMTRMLIVPFSFGWSALALQLLPDRTAVSHPRPHSRRGSARTP